MATVIPASGLLLRRFGARRQFIGAMTMFVSGTLIAALAPNFGILVAARIVQGVAAAAIMPTFMATIAARVPTHRHGAVMGMAVMAVSAAPALGPASSGIWIHHFGWRGLFWMIFAVAGLVLLVGSRALARDTGLQPAPVDGWSLPLSFLGFGGSVLGLTMIQRGQTLSGAAILLVGAVFVTMFVLRQIRTARVRAPYLDVRIFTSRRFALAVITAAAVSATLTSTISIVPFLLQDVLAASTSATGSAMLPAGITVALLAPLAGRLVDRVGPGPIIVPGICIVLSSVVALALMPASLGIWSVVIAYTIMHVGLAGLVAPLSAVALGAVDAAQAPDASATYSTSQQLAGAVSTATLIGVMQAVSGAGAAATIDGVHAAFAISAGVVCVALASASALVLSERS